MQFANLHSNYRIFHFLLKQRQIPPDETLQIGGDKKDNDQDLYGSDGHNWRSIIFSLLVIGFVITGIVIAIYLLG